MKTLIVYDSLYGHTQQIAEAIKEGLGSAHDARVVRAQEVQTTDFENIGLLLIGSPTHGGWYTESIKTLLEKIPEGSLEGLCAVTFDTSTLSDNHGFVVNALTRLFGNAAPRISKELMKRGANCVDSEIFYVVGKQGPLINGEVERARNWAGKLMKKAVK